MHLITGLEDIQNKNNETERRNEKLGKKAKNLK